MRSGERRVRMSLVRYFFLAVLFLGCAIEYDGSSTSSLNEPQFDPIPDECFSVRQGGVLFEYTCEYENIAIPDFVTVIDAWVFFDKAIKRIRLPSNLTRIGHSAFKSNHLVSLQIPDSVVQIEDSAFESNRLSSVNISSSSSLIRIGESVFCRQPFGNKLSFLQP